MTSILEGGGVSEASAGEPACFALAGLADALSAHGELDLPTLVYHLRQSDATAAEGYCHAAINEARCFLEALVVGIERSVRPDDELEAVSQNGTAFRTFRRRLQACGFIDADENDLVQYVYGIASIKGSHRGIADEAWMRLARRMVFATGHYLLGRYVEWKRGGRACSRGEAVSSGCGESSRRRGWVGRAVRFCHHRLARGP